MSSFITKDNLFYTTSSEVATICESFFTTSQINYFNCYRFFKSGEFYGLITTPELIDYHFSKNRVITPNLTIRPENNKFHYLLSPDLDDGFNQAVLDFRSYFNAYNFLYLYERTQDYFDLYVYHYSGNPALSFDYYFSNMDKLEQWKLEFKEKAQHLLTLADNNRIAIPPDMRPNNNNYCAFESEDNPVFSDNLLTCRQIDCLYHLAQGMTAKEIAKKLSLSHRTVEHYLDNIRAKLNCSSRSELVKQAFYIPAIKTKLFK